MPKYIFFFFILLLCACNQHTNTQYSKPKERDINNIIKAIIIQDSLSDNNIPIDVNLRKIEIKVLKLNLPPPPHLFTISIKKLLNPIYNANTFSKNDSSYLLFQNDILKSFRLKDNLISTVKLFTKPEDIQSVSLKSQNPYYQLSIPIFSTNQKKAYVEINHYCPDCGSGYGVFLEKIKSKWRIVKKINTWMN